MNINRDRIQSFKQKLKKELQVSIKNVNKQKHVKTIIEKIEEAYHPNYFDYLECQKMTTNGGFDDMFKQAKKLGEGCQSVVRKVIHKKSNQPYAVKTFKKADAQMLSKMKPLFLFLRSLKCSTIMKPHWLFISEKNQILRVILDYIESPNLQQILSIRKKFTLKEAQQLLKILLETLSYFHSRNACHRDVKPANILYDINATNKVKGFRLIDYQICKFTKSDIVQMWTPTGSLFYKAPQMFSHQAYNQKVDVWSVGIIAFQLLHGHVPFQQQFTNQTVNSICFDAIQSKLDPSLDSLAKQFIVKCLSKNPLTRLSCSQALQSPFILNTQCSTSIFRKLKRSCSSYQIPSKRARRKSFVTTNSQCSQFVIFKQQ